MLFVGFETLSPENLSDINKRFNHPQQIEETVQRLHGAGIACWAPSSSASTMTTSPSLTRS